MIAYIKGTVTEIRDNAAVIETGGIGRLFFASGSTLERLRISEAAVVHTEMVVREDSISLYGFYDVKEMEMFRLLTTVQGVGPKVALGILSSLKIGDISRAIASGDAKTLGRANGVGPKLAARLVTELKGKVHAGDVVAASLQPQAAGSDFENAISALLNLGYYRSEAALAVDRVLAQHPGEPLGRLIKLALKEMDKK